MSTPKKLNELLAIANKHPSQWVEVNKFLADHAYALCTMWQYAEMHRHKSAQLHEALGELEKI